MASSSNSLPVVLTVAGSDPSGGAGIEADLKVITAHHCYGMTAITALTAQNTQKVYNIHETPVDFFKQSLDIVLADITPDAIKTGMLGSAAHIDALVKALEDSGRKYRVVVDPVMVSTSGSQLLPNDAVTSMVEHLLPVSYMITPNYPEALLLAKTAGLDFKETSSVAGLVELAKLLHTLGPKIVFLKGGHCAMNAAGTFTEVEEDKKTVADVYYDGGEPVVIGSKYISSKHTHGTGCSLSAAIASQIALGETAVIACRKAVDYVAAGIASAPELGKGKGPINHLHSSFTLPYPPGGFTSYLINHPSVQPHWLSYTQHSFVSQLGDGTLPLSVFKHYMLQDYLFLVQFARANALAAYKSRTGPDIFSAARSILSVEHEMQMHITLCASYGISFVELQAAEESAACTAYTRYVLDIGQSQDRLALEVAMASCAIGYKEIGRWLLTRETTVREGNPYWTWIQAYTSVEYVEVVGKIEQWLEVEARGVGVKRVQELVGIFEKVTRLEERFWGSALALGKGEGEAE